MDKINFSYKSPESLLKELGITEPEDIDIEAIAEYCKATIVYEPLSGCEARIIGYGEKAIITVNQNSIREKQRFSAAHELGHWMCDRGEIASICTERMLYDKWFQDDKESRANKYAADILLPKYIFCPRAKNKEITFLSAKDLANDFKTSLTATSIRLVEFGSYPSMIVCNEFGQRRWRWFKKSPNVPDEIWPCDIPGRDSVAYDILHGNNPDTQSPIDVYADNWINQPDAYQYEIREHTIKITTNFVLTLLWWKDESQLIDLDEEDDY